MFVPTLLVSRIKNFTFPTQQALPEGVVVAAGFEERSFTLPQKEVSPDFCRQFWRLIY